jgi:hypothetical protein
MLKDLIFMVVSLSPNYSAVAGRNDACCACGGFTEGAIGPKDTNRAEKLRPSGIYKVVREGTPAPDPASK